MIKRYLIVGDSALKLYHVSRNINKKDYFEPRIPRYSSKNESKQKRICVSTSIEGAISATFYQWFTGKNTTNDNGGAVSLNQIDNYYNYDKLNKERDKIYFELITQILVRESDNIVTRLFLEKLKLMDENNMVSDKVSHKLEKEYFMKR